MPLDDVIPAEKRDLARRAIRAAFGDSRIEALAQLPNGASGPAAVFRLGIEGADFLLRMEGPRDGFRDPARQYMCLKIAGDAGVSPRLIYSDAQDGVAITEFVRTTRDAQDWSRMDRLGAIVGTIKALHAAPLFPRLMPYVDCVGNLIGQAHAGGVLAGEAVREHLRLYGVLAAAYPRDERDTVSSHNDLNPSNVLFTGQRPWIVDWESAFAADRYVDLTAVTNFFAVDEADEALILKTYFGSGLREYHRARLFLMQQVNRMFYAVVLLGSVAAVEPGFRLTRDGLDTPRFNEVRGEMTTLVTHAGRKRFACVFLNEMLHGLRSPRFASSIALMRMPG
jgi:aminoglycoside phosphotransferase (APT) family kinase protein